MSRVRDEIEAAEKDGKLRRLSATHMELMANTCRSLTNGVSGVVVQPDVSWVRLAGTRRYAQIRPGRVCEPAGGEGKGDLA